MTILSGTTAAPRVNGISMNGHSKPHTNGAELNGHAPKATTESPWPQSEEKTLLDKFVEAYHEFESYK